MKINYLWTHGMSSIKEQGDMFSTLTHPITQSGMLTRIGLFKSGNLMNWWKLEHGDLFMNNHLVCSQDTRTNLLLMTMMWTVTPTQNQTCRYYPDHSCTGWMIECERFNTNPSKDATQDSNKHSLMWRVSLSSTLEASEFMGKNYSEILYSIKNTGNDLTMKQMFDISENFIKEQSDETMEWIQLIRVILHGNIYLWLVAMKSSASRAQRFTYFQILCYALERRTRTNNEILSGKTSWRGSKVHHNTELWTQLIVSQWNSSGIFSRDHYIGACPWSPKVHEKI